jgi:hypothetical protein
MCRLGLLLAAVGLSLGCTMRHSAIWVEEGSSTTQLRFGVGATRGSRDPIDNLNLIRVSACGVAASERGVSEKVMWLATGSAVSEALAGTFAYGQPPAGLTNREGPMPLAPGCYVIDISGTGISAGACFQVSASGAVTRPATTVIDCQVRDRAS